MSRPGDTGLSLAEVLVSLAILSMVGLASVTLLTTLVRTDAALDGRAAQFQRLDQAMALLRNSLANAVPGSLEVSPDRIAFTLGPQMSGRQMAVFLRDGVLTREVS